MRNSLLFVRAVKFWILYLIFDKNAWDLGKSVISCVRLTNSFIAMGFKPIAGNGHY